MNVQRVARAASAASARAPVGPRSSAPAAPRLPPPLGLHGLLHAAQLSSRKTQQTASFAELESAQNARRAHTESARAAQRRAEEAAAKTSSEGSKASFWKNVAIAAAAVGAVASVVATGGASAPLMVALAGVALSASSPYIGQAAAKVSGDQKVGDAFATGAFVTGAALSIAGGGASLFTTAGAGSGTLQVIAAKTAVASNATAGAAKVGEGVYTIREKGAESDYEHARADVLQAKSAARRAQQETEAVIEQLKALEGSVRRALDAVAGVGREIESGRQFLNQKLARSLSA